MTNQEKNIAIHEYLGWEKVLLKKGTFVDIFSWKHRESGKELRHTPYYTKDLNAIHKAEDSLNKEQMIKYVHSFLRETTGGHSRVRATALQRTDAFLKTIGKLI